MKISRRDFALAAAAFAVLPGQAAFAQNKIPLQRRVEFTAQQREDLDRLSAYLNGIDTLAAQFVQTTGQGSSQGDFYLARPGRLRFEYRPPNPTLVVATGGNIYVRNSRLNTVDRYSVQDTPLGLLLADTIDLKRNTAVLGVDRLPGQLLLRARSSTNRMQDNIAIVFADAPQIQIQQWTVRDSQGGSTSVVFGNVQTGVPIAPEAFAIPVKAPTIRKGGN